MHYRLPAVTAMYQCLCWSVMHAIRSWNLVFNVALTG